MQSDTRGLSCKCVSFVGYTGTAASSIKYLLATPMIYRIESTQQGRYVPALTYHKHKPCLLTGSNPASPRRPRKVIKKKRLACMACR